MSSPRRNVATYLVLTFGLSSIFYTLIIRAGTLSAAHGMYVLGLMWCPGTAGILTMLINTRGLRGMGWGLGRPKWLALAYLLPVAYAGVAYGVVWAGGWGVFTTAHLPAGASTPKFVVEAATLGVCMSLISATWEEIGWRGVLVPQLSKFTGFTGTALISSGIWALWHTPVLLFADYNSGTPWWFGLTCFAVMVLGIGTAFAWIRLRSGSLWTGALLHASHNLFIQGVFDRMTADTGHTAWITGEFGVALALCAVGVGILFWRRRGELPAPDAVAAAA